MRGVKLAAGAVLMLGPSVATAQAKEEPLIIPASAMPPEGMCRLWLKDVPERQQPAATDCVTAIRTRPRDAILLLGEPSKNAKLPPRQPVNSLTGRNEPFGRSSGLNSMRTDADRIATGRSAPRVPPSTATRPSPTAAATAAAPAAAVKAPDTKAAVVKPPEQHQH